MSVSKAPRADDFDDLPVSPRSTSAFDMRPVIAVVDKKPDAVEVAPAAILHPPVFDVDDAHPARVLPTPAKPRPPRAPVPRKDREAAAPWDSFALPKVDVKIRAVPDVATLLAGPVRPAAVFLPRRLREAAAAIRAQARSKGQKLSYRTLYAHALAYAYQHPQHWLSQVPTDGRRRDAETNLTTSENRTTMAMTAALDEATQSLLLEASIKDFDRAPAGENVKTTAIAWAMSQLDEWLPAAVNNPVTMIGEGSDYS